jgi:hypothetical protein
MNDDMDAKTRAKVAELQAHAHEAADALRTQAAELHELTKRLEDLTQHTPAWYATTRTKVEARATLEQAEELGERAGGARGAVG